jgi:hypothetical protein
MRVSVLQFFYLSIRSTLSPFRRLPLAIYGRLGWHVVYHSVDRRSPCSTDCLDSDALQMLLFNFQDIIASEARRTRRHSCNPPPSFEASHSFGYDTRHARSFSTNAFDMTFKISSSSSFMRDIGRAVFILSFSVGTFALPGVAEAPTKCRTIRSVTRSWY